MEIETDKLDLVALITFSINEKSSLNQVITNEICRVLSDHKKKNLRVVTYNCANEATFEDSDEVINNLMLCRYLFLVIPIWNWNVPWQVKKFIDLNFRRNQLDGKTSKTSIDKINVFIVQTLGGRNSEYFSGSYFKFTDYLPFLFKKMRAKSTVEIVIENTDHISDVEKDVKLNFINNKYNFENEVRRYLDLN